MMNDRYIPDSGFSENFLRSDGRLNRWRYFKRQICLTLFAVVAIIFAYIIFTDDWGYETDELYIATGIIVLGVNILSYFLNVRRLHDLGEKNTLAIVLLVLGIITAIFSESDISTATSGIETIGTFYLLLKKGVAGPNEYGPDPLGSTMNDDYQQNQDNYSDNVDIPDFNSHNISTNNNDIGEEVSQDLTDNHDIGEVSQDSTDNHDDEEDSQDDDDDDDVDF